MITYDIEHDGVRLEYEFSTLEAAEAGADVWWADYVVDDMEVGETQEDVVYIVGIDEDGNEVSRKRKDVEYTLERSDYEEHRTY